MSHVASNWALYETPRLSGTRKLVLMILADFANGDTHVAWPSRARIAELAGCSRDLVKQHLRELCADGYLSAIEQYRGSDGARIGNQYRLNVGHSPEQETEGGENTPPQGAGSPTPVNGLPGAQGAGYPAIKEEPKQEPKQEPTTFVRSAGAETDGSAAKPGSETEVRAVFERHLRARRTYFERKNGQPPRPPDLTPELRRAIRAAIQTHGFEKAMAAGVGIFYSDFHTGKDPRPEYAGKEFLDPLLCWRMNGRRNNVEEFARLYDEAELAYARRELNR